MCQTNSAQHNKRELVISDEGKVIQCLCCESIGIEYGTSYLVFDRDDFYRFSNWFLDAVVPKSQKLAHKEKTMLQLTDQQMLLALTQEQVQDLAALLVQARQWLLGGPSPRPTHAWESMRFDGTVH